MAKCSACGDPTSFGRGYCDACWDLVNTVGEAEAKRRARARAEGTGVSVQLPADAILSAVRKTQIPVVNRYRDGYRVATFLIAVGNIIKIIGAVAGAIIFLAFASAGQQFGSAAGALVGLALGGITAGIGFVLGVLVSAQGQILRAALDTSVSTSHFMTDHERTVAMGLPASVAEPEHHTS